MSVDGVTPLEDLVTRYATPWMKALALKYREFEHLANRGEAPASCKHVYADTSYGDGVICTPCATDESTWDTAVRYAKAEIDADRAKIYAHLVEFAGSDTVLLFTPVEMQLLARLMEEMEKPRCI